MSWVISAAGARAWPHHPVCGQFAKTGESDQGTKRLTPRATDAQVMYPGGRRLRCAEVGRDKPCRNGRCLQGPPPAVCSAVNLSTERV